MTLEILYSRHLENWCLDVCQKNNDFFLQVKDIKGTYFKIAELNAPFEMSIFKQPKAKNLLENLYIRVSPFDDLTARVDLTFRLLGGMMDPDDVERARTLGVQTASNPVLKERILRNLDRANSGYSQVEVTIEPYFFTAQREELISRKISLMLTKGQSFVKVLQGIIAAFGIQQQRFSSVLNDTALASAILGNPNELAVEELIRAYDRGERIDVYISLDLRLMDAVTAQSVGYQIAQNTVTNNYCCIS